MTRTRSAEWFDLHGLVALRVEARSPALRQLRTMFRPFHVTRAPSSDVPVITVSRRRPVPLAGASYGEHTYVFTDDAVELTAQRCGVARTADGFAVWGRGELLTTLLPLVDVVSVGRGAAMVHAATVQLSGTGVCLPAWGGVGKTSTVAKLTAVPGGRFLGDDWAWLHRDGRLLGYAKPMFLKPHHRVLYPEVFAHRHKPLAPSRLTDRVARLATTVHPVVIRYPRVADATRRWSPEHVMVQPDEVFDPSRIGTTAPLGLVCFLERWTGETADVRTGSTEWLVGRMVGNFHAELPRTSRDVLTALAATGLLRLEEMYAAKAAVLARALDGLVAHQLRIPAAWDADTASDTVRDQVLGLLSDRGRPVTGISA